MIIINKIITAINNPNLNNKLKMENNIEIVCKDLQYKDAILDILNINNNVDIIIINDEIPSEINNDELIKKIREKNEKIRIIYILEKLNKKSQEILEKNNISEIYYNKEIDINKIIEIINLKNINNTNNLNNYNKNFFKRTENIKNIFKIKNILNIKNINKKNKKIIIIKFIFFNKNINLFFGIKKYNK